MKNKKISIIVPVYNSELWIERCIESVLNQTYKSFELILVNDGSIDRSEEICLKYKDKDSRIIYFFKENSGASDSRNFGLEKSNGKYIQFLDSDDYLDVHFCEKMIDIIEKNNSQLAICGFNIWKNDVLLRQPHINEKVINIKEGIFSYDYIHSILASPCNKVYIKEYIKKNFEKDLSLGEDLSFNLDYLKNINEVSCISDSLYNVSLDNKDSLNRKFRIDRLDIMLSLSKKEVDFCKKMYNEEYYGYNQYIYSYHFYFKEIIMHENKKNVCKLYTKYINDDMNIAIKKCKMNSIYYRFFVKILSTKSANIIYNFLKLRLVLEKMMGKRK